MPITNLQPIKPATLSATVLLNNSLIVTGAQFNPSKFRRWSPKKLVLSAQASSSGVGLKKKRRVDISANLSLDNVRSCLIRQEDTIIFCLLERSQFLHNAGTYDPKAFSENGFEGSMVEFLIKQTQELDGLVSKYEDPLAIIPRPVLSSQRYPQKIWDLYFIDLLPKLVKTGDDGNYGSSAFCDTSCLQAISKRIHYGNCVAEAKFRASPSDYEPAIREQNPEKIKALLTDENMEVAVKSRVERKARTFGQVIRLNEEILGDDPIYKIKPSLVVDLYGDWIMPLTKEVQVNYLMERLG